MNKRIVRILALVLCAVMILGMIPMIVNAEEIQPRQITQDDPYNYRFETFEDLKELAAGSYDTWCSVEYVGSDPLVITEDLTVPANLDVYGWDASLVVPQGVSFSINTVSFQSVIVEGKMTCGNCSAGKELRVTGKLIVNEYVYLNWDTQLTGFENISFSNKWGSMNYECQANTIEEFWEILDAASGAKDTMQFQIYIQSDMTIPHSITVPSNVRLMVSRQITIPAGVAVTLCGSMTLHAPLVIAGELNNQSGDQNAITIRYDGANGGQMILEEGGSFAGNRRFYIDCYEEIDLQMAVPGLDLSNYDIRDEGWGYYYLLCLDDVTRLGTPTDLLWGYDTVHNYDYETDTEYYTREPSRPGYASWKVVEPEQGQVRIDFYRVEEGEDIWVDGTSWGFSNSYLPEYRAVDTFALGNPESGTYYFTVTSYGDETKYLDSETAVSDTWDYVKPDMQLDTCTNVRFDDSYNIKWDAPSQTEYIWGYQKEWSFCEVPDQTPDNWVSTWGPGQYCESTYHPSNFTYHGVGYYYFRVRAISTDITKCANGEWTEYALAFHITEIPGDVSEEFDAIMDNVELPAVEKLQQLQELDTNDLRDTMRADNYVVDQIARLEEELGGPAEVAVSDAVADFDASKISVVGANLNNAGEDVTLVLDKPQEEHVIPAQYHNSVAVSFSMDLENVENTEELAIPVEITLPVPANINPSFLVVLHYHNDGTMEEIRPSLYQRGSQWYATFLLTSFSDFVMTEYKSEIPGDMNGDGIVNDTDVAHLLWHTLFPDMYEIIGNADFNQDGNVDDADVAYLLWHTLFPESYPIS